MRKVLGASTASVTVLLSSQSTRLVVIAVVIAHTPDLSALGVFTSAVRWPALGSTCSATRLVA